MRLFISIGLLSVYNLALEFAGSKIFRRKLYILSRSDFLLPFLIAKELFLPVDELELSPFFGLRNSHHAKYTTDSANTTTKNIDYKGLRTSCLFEHHIDKFGEIEKAQNH